MTQWLTLPFLALVLTFTVNCDECVDNSWNNWILPTQTIESIEQDLIASYSMLDHLKWDNTNYKYLSCRYLNDTIITIQINDKNNISFSQFPLKDMENEYKLYKDIYLNRPDINAIFHVYNPCLSAISYSKHGMLPIDQDYYAFYPISYNIDDIIDNKQYTKYNYSSYILLLNNSDGVLMMGPHIHATFNRLNYLLRLANVQCITMSIIKDRNDIIFPPQQIQLKSIKERIEERLGTIYNTITSNGIPQFNLLKRKFGYIHNNNNAHCKQYNHDISNLDIATNLAKIHHVLDTLGWTDTIYQHLTARIPLESDIDGSTDTILMNPFGLGFFEADYDKFVQVAVKIDIDKLELNSNIKAEYNIINGGNSEFASSITYAGLELHSAIYVYRKDVQYVLHLHHPYLSAISVYEHGLLPLNKLYYDIIKPITYHSFDGFAANHDKWILMQDFGSISNVIILRNHGIIVTGKDVESAFNRLYYTIELAKVQIDIMKMGILNDNLLSEMKQYINETNQENQNNVLIESESPLNAWKRFAV